MRLIKLDGTYVGLQCVHRLVLLLIKYPVKDFFPLKKKVSAPLSQCNSLVPSSCQFTELSPNTSSPECNLPQPPGMCDRK